jgi:hypothetical protein
MEDNKANYGITAIGHYAMNNADDRTVGVFTANTAVGYYALAGSSTPANNTGTHNTVMGNQSMYDNTSGGFNTAVGSQALTNNTSGGSNCALGYNALGINSTGYYNTAMGLHALYANTNSYNTAFGYDALGNTSNSQFNTAVGFEAGRDWNNGYNNVFVGANTDVNAGGYFNVVAVGQGTTCLASSTARFGNSATGSYGGWAGWSNFSDRRHKRDVTENVPGLDFINLLRPVTYHLDATNLSAAIGEDFGEGEGAMIMQQALLDKEEIVYSGFIAQEVEEAAQSVGFDFSGVDKPKNDKDFYGLRYAEFTVPLVKAVQELSQRNAQMELENQSLREEINKLKGIEERLAALEAKLID